MPFVITSNRSNLLKIGVTQLVRASKRIEIAINAQVIEIRASSLRIEALSNLQCFLCFRESPAKICDSITPAAYPCEHTDVLLTLHLSNQVIQPTFQTPTGNVSIERYNTEEHIFTLIK